MVMFSGWLHLGRPWPILGGSEAPYTFLVRWRGGSALSALVTKHGNRSCFWEGIAWEGTRAGSRLAPRLGAGIEVVMRQVQFQLSGWNVEWNGREMEDHCCCY